MPQNKTIIAVASLGGHWIQLLRIAKPLEKLYDVTYVSTHNKCATMIGDSSFYILNDFSRWDAWRLIPATIKSLFIIIRMNPKAVISTGAAPGLIMLFVAKLCGKKTIWIDSIANAEQPSLCGKIASRFVTQCYTQWPYEASDRFKYSGNIFG